MGEITTVPLLGFILVLWAYLKFEPAHNDQKGIRVFNIMTIGLCAVLWLGWFFSWDAKLERMGLSEYRYLIGLGGGGAGAMGYLILFFLIRNFWIFADTRRPGRF